MAEARRQAARRAAADPRDPLATPLAWLRPIDSEHSAIWQCLVGEPTAGVARLVLTASGGPFLDTPAGRVRARSRRSGRCATRPGPWAPRSPSTPRPSPTRAWRSSRPTGSTMCRYDAIDVVVHPQSVVHSAVLFVDGSLKAQLGTPDMRLPIQYALTHPERLPSPTTPHRTWSAAARLDFRAPGRGAVPGPADRPRGGPRRAAGLGRADRRRRGGGRPVPRRHARLPRHPAPARGGGAPLRRGPDQAPDVPALVELDREVRAAFATGPIGGAA